MRESLRERRSREIRAARVNRRPAGLGATLMAFAIVFALAWVFFIRQPPQTPTPSITAVQGAYEWHGRGRGVPTKAKRWQSERGTFRFVSSGNGAGSARLTWPPHLGSLGQGRPAVVDSAYDAERRMTTTRYQGAGGWSGNDILDAWPPVWHIATHSPLDYQGMSAIVRSAVEDSDHSIGIKPLEEGGRDVWRAAMTFSGGDLVEVVVDQQSGLVTWYSETAPYLQEEFTAKPDWADPPATAEPDRLANGGTTTPGRVQRLDDGAYTYHPSLEAAGTSVGDTPLEPTLIPDGYSLAAVATFATQYQPLEWLSESGMGMPPPIEVDERGIALLYTRGLAWFTVEEVGPKATRLFEKPVNDELTSTATRELSYETETVQYGGLKGATAHTWYEKSGPTLYISDGRRSVYVTGALTRQELISLAEGLKPVVSGAASGGSPSASPTPSP